MFRSIDHNTLAHLPVPVCDLVMSRINETNIECFALLEPCAPQCVVLWLHSQNRITVAGKKSAGKNAIPLHRTGALLEVLE